MIRDAPEDAARALAAELGAELAVGGEATEAALERLPRGPGRDAPLPGVEPAPAPDVDRHRPDFEQLTRAMRRAEEIRDRTRRGVAERLTRTFNTALAIHPDSIRRAATELLEAEAALARARRGRTPATARTARRIRAGGIGGLTAAGVAIGALGALPVGAVVATVGVLGGAVTHSGNRRAVLATVPDLEAAAALARRRWEQLAGVGADPTTVDAVIHRYDPQHRVITDLLINSAAVRAADQLALHHRMAWVQAWRVEAGDASQAAPVAPRPVVDAGSFARTEAPARGGPAADEPRTLVVVGPYTELSEDRARALHRRLLTLPGGNRVIVVLGPDAVGGARPVVDLRDGGADQSDRSPATPVGEPAPAVIDLDRPVADPQVPVGRRP